MSTTTVTIHKAGQKLIEADAVSSPPRESNVIARGEQAVFTFENLSTRLIVESGDTETIPAGETEQIDIVTVNGTLVVDGTLEVDELEATGTVDVNGELRVNEKFAFGLDDLEAFRPFAGKYTRTETLNSTQPFREFVPGSGPDSLVIGIEPNADLQEKNIPGVWGLISSIDDDRAAPLATQRATVTVDVLAEYSAYADVSAVRSELEV